VKLAKISAEAAWSITHGSNSVIVGILDSGVNTAHPDFMPNLWSGQNNPDPKNFTTTPHSTNVSDGNGHGSNVASIVGARGNNRLYLSGVSWNVSLMHLKVLTDGTPQNPSHGEDDWIIDAINYARTNSVSAINLSFGGSVLDNALLDALDLARQSNVVAVCAAGNDGSSTDTMPFVPADYPTDNIISVAASDQFDAKPDFSNFGPRTVDLAAPGKAIYGLKPTFTDDHFASNYIAYDGTSQAAPHVTGTIALLKAKYGWEDYHGLRDRVLMGTDDVRSFAGITKNRRALECS
jgi:subtilisin family serine protease